MFSTRRLRVAAGLAVSALVAVVAVSTGTSANSQSAKIVIWADADRVPAVTQVANAWARAKGATVQVVQKQSGPIRQEVSTVAVENAPDVIVGAHDWVGELSGNGSIIPLSPSAATRKQFPAYALNAFSYGTAIKKLYGAPTALENIALVTNTRLAKVPKSFADLEKQALAAKKRTKAQVGLAVQQGSGGDAFHMYPFFSGLGGYIFGTNKAGNLDPSDIGVANARFLKNAALIDKWNKSGLVRSQVGADQAKSLFLTGKVPYYVTGPWFVSDIKKAGVRYAISAFPQIVPGIKSVPFLGVQGFMVTKFSATHGVESLAKDSFLKGKAAFWVTGPWEADTLKKSGLSYKIVQVPANKFKSVPFLGVQGFMVTKFAATHGLESAAKDLVGSYMMRPAGQTALAAANGRFPANLTAGKAVKDPVLAQFGRAGAGGVPMPNIPQMSSVWSDLGGAWVKATKGSGATKARIAFSTAARNIANKIG